MLPMEAPVRNSNSLLQVPPPMAETYTSPAARESSATSWKNVGAAFVPSRPGYSERSENVSFMMAMTLGPS